MTAKASRNRRFVAPRWLLVVTASIGATLGWFAIPYFKRWLVQFADHGPFATIFARAVELVMCYALLRSVADLITDIHDYLRRNGSDPLLNRTCIVDDRISWAATILLFWVQIESMLMAVLILVIGWAIFGGLGSWKSAMQLADAAGREGGYAFWKDTVGPVGMFFACYSIVQRNQSPPVFPLPFRWLGLSRYLRPDEVGRVKMAWSSPARCRRGDSSKEP